MHFFYFISLLTSLKRYSIHISKFCIEKNAQETKYCRMSQNNTWTVWYSNVDISTKFHDIPYNEHTKQTNQAEHCYIVFEWNVFVIQTCVDLWKHKILCKSRIWRNRSPPSYLHLSKPYSTLSSQTVNFMILINQQNDGTISRLLLKYMYQ